MQNFHKLPVYRLLFCALCAVFTHTPVIANTATLELIQVDDFRDFLRVYPDPFLSHNTSAITGKRKKVLFISAVAARRNDIFLIDSARRQIFRIDKSQRTISTFAPLASGDSSGLYLSETLSLYVVNRRQRQVIEFKRNIRS